MDFTGVELLAGLGSVASDSCASLLPKESAGRVLAFRLTADVFVVALRFAVAPAEVRGTVFNGRKAASCIGFKSTCKGDCRVGSGSEPKVENTSEVATNLRRLTGCPKQINNQSN